MNNWTRYLLIAGLTAGTASAAWWPFGSKKEEKKPEPPPAAHRPEGLGARMGQPTPEQMEKLKAARAEIMKLGEAARNETDPVKKEARIAELRARLTEMDDRMQQEFKKRVEQAEKELPKLKAKLAEAEKNRAARIEEQVQRILAGESLRRPEGHPKRERKSPPPTL